MGESRFRTIGATVVATAALTSLAVELYHYYQQTKPVSTSLNKGASGRRQKKVITETIQHYDEDLIREQLARNYAFLGEQGMEKIRHLKVVVVGAGGVGSWVSTMLVRSGVANIKVIDFDQVTLSSLNRHAVANIHDVGISKVDCLRNHLLNVAPWVEIEAVNELWTINNAARLLFSSAGKDRPDYVIDCIDNIDTKVDLLAFCHENNIPVISSGGAACKSDPTRMNIGDIRITEEDALVKSVRRRLKKRGINTGITVAFSAEKPDPRKASLLPLPDEEYEKGKVDELTALQNFRVRILPVLGPMPGMFGLTIVSHLLTTVAGYPIEAIEGKNRMKVYDSVLMSLAAQQVRCGHEQQLPISMNDIEYIVEEVFRGKSPLSGYSTRLTLSRWDFSKDLSLQNCVLMTKEEQKNHEKLLFKTGKKPEDVYSEDVVQLVKKRFAEEEYYSQFR